MIRAMAYCGPASDSSPKPDRFKKPPSGKNVRTLVSLPPIERELVAAPLTTAVALEAQLRGERLPGMREIRAIEGVVAKAREVTDQVEVGGRHAEIAQT